MVHGQHRTCFDPAGAYNSTCLHTYIHTNKQTNIHTQNSWYTVNIVLALILLAHTIVRLVADAFGGMRVCMYVCVYVCVCMYNSTPGCRCVWYAYMCVCMCVCMHTVVRRSQMHVEICMYVCMHVYLHACMHVCMYTIVRLVADASGDMYACMHVCIYMHVCFHVCICMYVCMYVCIPYYAFSQKHNVVRIMHACMHVCMCAEIAYTDALRNMPSFFLPMFFISIHMHTYIHTYTHKYTHTGLHILRTCVHRWLGLVEIAYTDALRNMSSFFLPMFFISIHIRTLLSVRTGPRRRSSAASSQPRINSQITRNSRESHAAEEGMSVALIHGGNSGDVDVHEGEDEEDDMYNAWAIGGEDPNMDVACEAARSVGRERHARTHIQTAQSVGRERGMGADVADVAEGGGTRANHGAADRGVEGGGINQGNNINQGDNINQGRDYNNQGNNSNQGRSYTNQGTNNNQGATDNQGYYDSTNQGGGNSGDHVYTDFDHSRHSEHSTRTEIGIIHEDVYSNQDSWSSWSIAQALIAGVQMCVFGMYAVGSEKEGFSLANAMVLLMILHALRTQMCARKMCRRLQVCVCVSMYVCACVCVRVCVKLWEYTCMYVILRITHTYMHTYIHTYRPY
jgi:hypothetical protein